MARQPEQIIPLSSLSPTQIQQLKIARWKARTDLGWFCRNVLGFQHVTDNSSSPCELEDGPDEPIHQPIIDILQRFPTPTTPQFYENDKLVGGTWDYKPITPLNQLPGARRVLILDPRGFLKTTINIVAHTIQIIINYPDVSILIVQSTGQKANDFCQLIKNHFQGNSIFRELFPEHCPVKNIYDWGRQDRFNSEARSLSNMRAEPTVMATSIDKGASGIHVDWMKFSDIVDPANVTGNGLESVKKAFYMMENLLVGPSYRIDVEGTRYHNADLYGKIIDDERDKPEGKKHYKIHVRPVFKQVGVKPGEHTPENLDADFELDAKGDRIPLWPRRFSLELLEEKERQDLFTFATQQLNNPTRGQIGGVPFPLDNEELRSGNVISRQNFISRVPIAYKEISVDTAYTQNRRSDFTAIVVGAFDHYGRCYIEEIVHGRFLPDQVNEAIIGAIMRHHRQLKCVKIEKTAYTMGMMPGLRRLIDPRNLSVTFNLIPRDTTEAKTDRILKTLQPWYASTDLRFVDDIAPDAMKALVREMKTFPGEHDDILDAISDLFQDKTWFGREIPHSTNTDAQLRHSRAIAAAELREKEWMRMIGDIVPYDPFYIDNSDRNAYDEYVGAA